MGPMRILLRISLFILALVFTACSSSGPSAPDFIESTASALTAPDAGTGATGPVTKTYVLSTYGGNIQAANDACLSGGGGQVVVDGVFVVPQLAKPIAFGGMSNAVARVEGHRFSNNVCDWVGDNVHRAVLRYAGTGAGSVFTSSGSAARARAIEIRHITFEGNPNFYGVMLDLRGGNPSQTNGTRLSDVTFLRIPGLALKMSQTYDVVMDRVYCREVGMCFDFGGPKYDGSDFMNAITIRGLQVYGFGYPPLSKAPAKPALTYVGGGVLAKGIYGYRVSALNADIDESAPSATATVSVAAGSAVKVVFPAVPKGAFMGWKVYGRAKGGERFLVSVGPTLTSWTDTGSISTSVDPALHPQPPTEYAFGSRIQHANVVTISELVYNSNIEQLLLSHVATYDVRDSYFEQPPNSNNPWVYLRQCGLGTIHDNYFSMDMRPVAAVLIAGRHDGGAYLTATLTRNRIYRAVAPPFVLGTSNGQPGTPTGVATTNGVQSYPVLFEGNQAPGYTGPMISFVNGVGDGTGMVYVEVNDRLTTTRYNGKGVVLP